MNKFNKQLEVDVDNITPATNGVSSFVTFPDYIPVVLIRNATEEQIVECMDVCYKSGKVYTVYIQTENSGEEWVWKIERLADAIIDAQNTDPLEYFNK